jgi:anti-sigma factor RsiW
MTNNYLTCKELVELVTDYLEGTLAPPEKERFDEHLGACPPCGVYLLQMRQTVRALGRLTEENILPQAKDELLRLFRHWKASR